MKAWKLVGNSLPHFSTPNATDSDMYGSTYHVLYGEPLNLPVSNIHQHTYKNPQTDPGVNEELLNLKSRVELENTVRQMKDVMRKLIKEMSDKKNPDENEEDIEVIY